jgi:gas vesicle protein
MRKKEYSMTKGFWTGIGIGIAAGMILAPRSGTETRRMLSDRARERRDALRRQGQEMAESARETIRRTGEAVTAAVDAGRQAYNREMQQEPGSTQGT